MSAQGVMVGMWIFYLILVGMVDGTPRDDKWSLSKAMFGVGISAAILWWGGFWDPWLHQ